MRSVLIGQPDQQSAIAALANAARGGAGGQFMLAIPQMAQADGGSPIPTGGAVSSRALTLQQGRDALALAEAPIEQEAKRKQIENAEENARIRNAELSFAQAQQAQKLDMALHPDRYPESREQAIHRLATEAQIEGNKLAREQQGLEREYQHSRDTVGDKRFEQQMEATAAERAADNARADRQLGLTEAQQKAMATERAEDNARDESHFRATLDSTERNRRSLDEDRNANRESAAATRAADAQARKQQQDTTFKTTFATKSAKDAKILGVIDEIDNLVGKYEGRKEDIPGFSPLAASSETVNDATSYLSKKYKQLKGEWTDHDAEREADGDRMRKLQNEVSQAILRGETGAAAATREETKTNIRSGLGATATAAQRKEALKVARELHQKQIALFGAGNPAAARESLAEAGINNTFIHDPETRARRIASMGAQAPSAENAGTPPTADASPDIIDWSQFEEATN